MDWRTRLMEHARRLGRDVYDDPLGVGVDFADGCDAFWVLPGEVMSTVPVPADGPASVDALIDTYTRIDHLRDRALHVIRHYLTSNNCRYERRRNGQWPLNVGLISTTFEVGASLTIFARDLDDVHAVVTAVIKRQRLLKAPSRRRIDRYLAIEGPPANERGPGDADPAEAAGISTIRAALGWMGLCRALDHAESYDSAEAMVAAAKPRGRVGQALLALAERLPDVEGSTDLLKPGQLSLTFPDGQASFDIDTRSRSLARQAKANGPGATADALAAEYRSLAEARSRVLRAIRQAAAARGWRRYAPGSAAFTGTRECYLGQDRREVQYDEGPALTEALRSRSPGAVLRSMFMTQPDFAAATVAALDAPLPDEQIHLAEGPLAPSTVPAAPPLQDLDATVVARMDRFAAETLREYLSEPRHVWQYRDPLIYDRLRDDWCTLDDWVRLASPLVESEWPNSTAVQILLDAGDPRGAAAARACLERVDPDVEGSGNYVEIIWRYRHERPDIASKWFPPVDEYQDIAFAQQRAAAGDPVARRWQQYAGVPDEWTDLTPAARHDAAMRWARTSHQWSPPPEDHLLAALEHGWTDVAAAMEQNPYMLAGLLTGDRRPDGFDEPGILMSGKFLLIWSRLAPSVFLARLIATARSTDVIGAAEQAARASVQGRPEVAANLPMSFDVYRAWMKDLEPQFAIAWQRCRQARVV